MSGQYDIISTQEEGVKMENRRKGKAAETLKKRAIWSAEAFGEGGYEIVPPEKEEEFRKLAEEESRRRRPGLYACDAVATARRVG